MPTVHTKNAEVRENVSVHVRRSKGHEPSREQHAHSFDCDLDTSVEAENGGLVMNQFRDKVKGTYAAAKEVATNIASGVMEFDKQQPVFRIPYEIQEGKLYTQGKSLDDLITPDLNRANQLHGEGQYVALPDSLVKQLQAAQEALVNNPDTSAVLVTSPDEQGRHYVQVFLRDSVNPEKVTSFAIEHKGDMEELGRFVSDLAGELGLETTTIPSTESAVVIERGTPNIDFERVSEIAQDSYLSEERASQNSEYLERMKEFTPQAKELFERQDKLAEVLENALIDIVSEFDTREEREEVLKAVTRELRAIVHELLGQDPELQNTETKDIRKMLLIEVEAQTPEIAPQQDQQQNIEPETEPTLIDAFEHMVQALAKDPTVEREPSSPHASAIEHLLEQDVSPEIVVPVVTQPAQNVLSRDELDLIRERLGEMIAESLSESSAPEAIASTRSEPVQAVSEIQIAENLLIEPEETPDQEQMLERLMDPLRARAKEELEVKQEEIHSELRKEMIGVLEMIAEREGKDTKQAEKAAAALKNSEHFDAAMIIELIELLDLPTRERIMLLQEAGIGLDQLEVIEQTQSQVRVQHRYKITPDGPTQLAA